MHYVFVANIPNIKKTELRTQNSELRNLFNIKYEDFSNI